MKRVICLILLVLLAISPVLASEEYHTMDEMTLNQEISNSVLITQTGSNYFIDHFDITLKLAPKSDNRQSVIDSEFIPFPIKTNPDILFSWSQPALNTLRFESNFEIETTSEPGEKIVKKVNFPLSNIPDEVLPYLDYTEHIDINNDIQTLASTLAGNEDDLFMVEFALADWVNKNIEYNLSTITSEADQPSSWVLEERYGVCDEITNLFISLNRALGIPARFVSGIAYSDSILFSEKWGNHGWAEVYFPGYGWVEYDVTYNQLGYIDATHISLYKAVDGSSSSVEYSSVGRDYEFSQQGLEFETSIIKEGKKRSPKSSVDVDINENVVGIGSYNLVTATITNNQPYYIVEWVLLGKTTDLELLSPNEKRVALAPRESKEVSWLLKVDDDLDEGFYYTFPVVVVDSLNNRHEAEFTVRSSGELFTKEYMNQFNDREETIKPLPVSCSVNEYIFLGEPTKITCTSTQYMRLCMDQVCQQGESFEFDVDTKTIGVFTKKLYSGDQTTFVTYRVSDISSLDISSISIPPEISFKEDTSLIVTINKTSWASPEDVKVVAKHSLFTQEWSIESLQSTQTFEVLIPKTLFTFGENEIVITATYFDNRGDEQVVSKEVTTTLVNLTFSQKMQVLLNTLAAKVDKSVSKHSDKLDSKGIPQSKAVVVIIGSILTTLFIMILQKSIRLILRRN